jgi:predicted patatin/cPLA2 family phospholipase
VPDGVSLAAEPPAARLREPSDGVGPVLRLVLERAQRGDRDDGHVVCLAVEGGGMRGAVTAGMCVVLEAAGLVGAFDRVYGVSAGALNALATATGRAALSATHYEDAARRRVVNPVRPLLGRPVIDYDLLFDDVIASRKPLAPLNAAPEFRALATSLETGSLRVLAGFLDPAEALSAVRASAALPALGGPPPVFRGERTVDGALLEPIPYATPLAEGATHVLVLRSRPAAYRQPALSERAESLAVREPLLAELVKRRYGVYNRQAAELERLVAGSDPLLEQVAVTDGTRLIGRLAGDPARVYAAVRAGARAMAAAALAHPVDLCWQPVIYRAA